jgi:competence protein ComEA
MKISGYYNALKLIIRNYFGFSLREANGFIVLILLMVFLLTIPFFISIFLSNDEEIKVEINTLKKFEKPTKQTPEPVAIEETPFIQKKLFNFNPNVTSIKSLNDLGISQKTVLRIDNFRKKGGKFKIKTDLLKIYGFDTLLYQQLEPYIQLPENISKEIKTEEKEYLKPTVEKVLIDINKADSAEWTKLKGIGPAFASRIIKYRNKLGGFYAKKQLLEVYGLDEEKYNLIEPFLEESELVNTISINTVTYEELSAHPYINRNLAKVILNYKDAHGNFSNTDDLKKIKILTSETLDKIAPYLDFK